ncbi:MAG: hypothetical protein QNJ14_09575 [Woeseiaceae bacterium]|nr:hypothetical protein [Woeseiaceae bacterium]
MSVLLLVPLPILAEQAAVQFSGYDWVVRGSKWSVDQFLGRESLHLERANATLSDVEFYNGVIEFDIAVSGNRGFSSVRWRRQEDFSGENFLVRNHKSGERDALQYEAFHGFRSSWQLYNKDGYTTPAHIPANRWLPVKIVVKDRQADIYFDSDVPVIHVAALKGADSPGIVQLNGALDGARFSNFRIDTSDPPALLGSALKLPAPPDRGRASIVVWEIARVETPTLDWSEAFDIELYPTDIQDWQLAEADTSGVMNLSEYFPAPSFGRSDDELSIALARSVIRSAGDQSVMLKIGYSDYVAVFINGTLLFSGSNRFSEDDRRYQGLVDLDRQVRIPLREGDNELLLMVGEEDRFGWGFATQVVCVKDANVEIVVRKSPSLEESRHLCAAGEPGLTE